MEYLQAIRECKKGDKIRCILMDEGEYISYDEVETRLLWWDETHSAHWSYPGDCSDKDYNQWLFSEWEVCNNIKPVKKGV